MRARNVYYSLLTLSLLLGLYSILTITPLQRVFLNESTILGFFHRLFGLWGFTLLFFQILLGSGMVTKSQKLGSWVHKVHITQGLFAYAFVFFHPFLMFLQLVDSAKVLNPFYIYTDICILCKTRPELYRSFGRVSFWILTFTIVAARLRTVPVFRRYWRFFHYVNYVVFFAVSLHAWYLGTDVHTPPYSWFHVLATTVVGLIVLKKVFRLTMNLFKNFELRTTPSGKQAS